MSLPDTMEMGRFATTVQDRFNILRASRGFPTAELAISHVFLNVTAEKRVLSFRT